MNNLTHLEVHQDRLFIYLTFEDLIINYIINILTIPSGSNYNKIPSLLMCQALPVCQISSS